MAIQYSRLWKLLIDKRMKKTDLIKVCGISSNVLARLGKGESVSIESLEKICTALDCNIEDIMEFVPNGKVGEQGLRYRNNTSSTIL